MINDFDAHFTFPEEFSKAKENQDYITKKLLNEYRK